MSSPLPGRPRGSTRRIGPIALALLAIALVAVLVRPTGAYELRRVAFSGGAVKGTEGALSLRGTVGEAGDAGQTSGGSYRLGGGFWPGHFRLLATAAPALGDVSEIRWENGLAQSFPNPFRRSATVSFSLARDTPVRLTVFDVTGRRVATLVDDVRAAGAHEVRWGGRDDSGRPVASGLFFYRLDAGAFSRTKRMLHLR